MTENKFTEDYFLRGPKAGLSNFENYRWMPDATISMATHLKRYLALCPGDRFLDVGCARGYLVKALRMVDVHAFGYDISEWAIANCDPDVKPYVSNHLNGGEYYTVFSKDTFEHIPPDDLRALLAKLIPCTRKRMFVIVPLAKEDGGEYVHPKEENDSTHVNRFTLPTWMDFLQASAPGFIVNGSYRYPGLKPGCYEVEHGYGFITLERI